MMTKEQLLTREPLLSPWAGGGGWCWLPLRSATRDLSHPAHVDAGTWERIRLPCDMGFAKVAPTRDAAMLALRDAVLGG